MERYCGHLQPIIKSRRHPFAAIDRFVTMHAQLSAIKIRYNLREVLALRKTKSTKVKGQWSHPSCKSSKYTIENVNPDEEVDPTCVLLPKRGHFVLDGALLSKVTSNLATRFNVRDTVIKPLIQTEEVVEWGAVRRIDDGGGDTMHTSGLVSETEDRRDATFVKVC